jgi:hypothetical protein
MNSYEENEMHKVGAKEAAGSISSPHRVSFIFWANARNIPERDAHCETWD